MNDNIKSDSQQLADQSATEPFPMADIQPAAGLSSGRLLQSKMWWITLLCLSLAIYVSWTSHRPSGIEITIDFPQGHGLKVGDALQHRGIEIGIVTSVELASDLNGVRTTLMLEKSAAGITTEDSEFWIVRPQLSLTNVSGLETAIGAKYIAVHPGTSESKARNFTGLKYPLAVAVDEEGIEIVLRGTESYGINPGSPVTYRGIRVGQISSVDLGEDSLSVVIQARINKRYQTLLRQGSKFWKTSGVDMDFGLKGFHLSTESLTTVAQGGVSFVTPTSRDESGLEPIQNGHEFELAEEMESNWVRNAAAISLP